MIRAAVALAAALPLVGASRDPLAGRVAGAPAQCLELSRVLAPQIVDARTVLYRQSARRVWRATVAEGCPRLRPFARLIVEPTGAQLCRNDRFRVLEPNAIIPSSSCRFEALTPYDLPSPPR